MVFDRFADRMRERFKKEADAAPAAPETPEARPEPPAAAPSPAVTAPTGEPQGLLGRLQRGIQKGIEVLNTDIGELVPAAAPVSRSLDRLKDGLKRTRQSLVGGMVDLFRGSKRIDEAFWESVEEILITSDVGVATSTRLVDHLRAVVKERRLTEPTELIEVLRADVAGILHGAQEGLRTAPEGPTVIMVVGVNGTGKTTSIGKLTHRLRAEGKTVLLAAADTFRAAAIDQLQIWADRTGVDIIKLHEGADPAAVAYDAASAARARGVDVLIIDTAGRLHNKVNLMEELKKVRRVIGKQIPDAPHEVLLVLDATTGQNALQQARTFREVVDVSGLVLAKLDGTARGGIVIAIAQELSLPVKYIGVGEGIDDLQAFDAEQFLDALFATEEVEIPH